MIEPPAGWFPSPGAVGMLRWWDGREWTDHVRPTVEDAPTTPELFLPEPRASLEAQRVMASGRAPSATPVPQTLGPPGVPAYGSASSADPARPDRRRRAGTRRVRPRPGPAARTPPSGTVTPASAEEIRSAVHVYEGLNGTRIQVKGGLLGALVQLGMGIGLLVTSVVGVPGFLSAFTGPGETSTRGIVVDVELTSRSDSGSTCSVEAVFSVDGEEHPARSASSRCLAVGSPTPVIYRTASPGDGEARIPEPRSTVLPLLVVPVLGLLFAVTAVMGAVVETRALLSRRRRVRS